MTGPALATSFDPPAALAPLQRYAILVAVAGLGLSGLAVAFTGDIRSFYFAYLTAYVFWIGISVGCLALVMLQFVARGAWGVAIRRLLESGYRTLPMMAVLFIPVLLGLRELFEWARLEPAAADAVVRAKLPYLNAPFFSLRAIVVFSLWLLLAWFLQRWSAMEDRTANARYLQRARNLSGPGIVMYGLTVTLASTDWVMSLDPRWHSSIFGLLFMTGWGLSAMSFVLVALVWLSRYPPLDQIITERHLHDLGNLLFAFVLLFTYLQYSQYVIIWSGNLPEEASWYLRRLSGGWQAVGLLLIVLHFIVPAALLLSRRVKQRAGTLGAIASLLLLMRLVDAWYMVSPEAAQYIAGEPLQSRVPQGAGLLLYVLLPTGLGGLWLASFTRGLMKRPLLPTGDPLLARTLVHGRHTA